MHKIIKEYTFKDFKEVMEFVNKVAEAAEQLNHHPNILIHDYKKVRVEIYTHTEKTLTDKDYELEKRIEEIKGLTP